MRQSLSVPLVALLVAIPPTAARADNILFISGTEGTHPYSAQARQDLAALGHTLTEVQNPQPLSVYELFDQVWDFRYSTAMTEQDVADMGGYLRGGGRMLLLGEHGQFQGRNDSVRTLIVLVGGGNVGAPVQTCDGQFQTTTGPGSVVMFPNKLGGLKVGCGTTYAAADLSRGFLVVAGAGGDGSVIGWDLGDIEGAPASRLLACWDIELWQPGLGQDLPWSENCAAYLGGAVGDCYADFTSDGVLDLFDFLAYVNLFNADNTDADCTLDGVLDLFDFLCFLNEFNTGC